MYIISNDTMKDVQLFRSGNESTPGACPSLLFNCDRRMLEPTCVMMSVASNVYSSWIRNRYRWRSAFFRISGNSPHLGLLVQSVIEYDGTQTHFSGSPKIHTWTHAPEGLITKRTKHRKHSFSENKRKCTSRSGRIENQPKRSTNEYQKDPLHH